jgi:hypothetical protein
MWNRNPGLGLASGFDGSGLCFSHDPVRSIELGFETAVYVIELQIGENEGVGEVKHILNRENFVKRLVKPKNQ